MLSKSLKAIESKYKVNPPISVSKIEKFVNELRRDDVVSSNLFSRKCKLSPELSKTILNDLVLMKILDYFIIVPCTNSIENTEHYMTFFSLEEVNNYMNDHKICPVCNNTDSTIDLKRIKVGFKIHE